jgi:predicted RNase H-like HicB family nuclease
LEWNEDGGGYTVTVPALPGCVTERDTVQEAIENAQEAITGYLETLRLQGQLLPEKACHRKEKPDPKDTG